MMEHLNWPSVLKKSQLNVHKIHVGDISRFSSHGRTFQVFNNQFPYFI